MNPPRIVCYLPSKPEYSNSFLLDQIAGLGAYSLYLKDPFAEFPNQFGLPTWRERLSRKFQVPCYRALQHLRPNVVVAQYGVTGSHIYRICRNLKIPLVVHFHGFDASRKDILDFHDQAYREMFAYARCIISVSHTMTEALLAAGAPSEKVLENIYGVNLDLFRPVTPSQNSPHFLAVGRMVEKKAPWATLFAFAQVFGRYPQARLTFIGDGPLEGALRSMAQSLEVGEAVSFLGAQPHLKIQEVMREARCFVQHSKTAMDGDMEGTPVAILEASASALPIVSTFHAGIPQAVRHTQTGLLVEPGDIDSMARYMMRFIETPELADEMGMKGRAHVERFHDQTVQIARLREVVLKACGDTDPRVVRKALPDSYRQPLQPA